MRILTNSLQQNQLNSITTAWTKLHPVSIPLLWVASWGPVLPFATSQARSILTQHSLEVSATIKRLTTPTVTLSMKRVLTIVSGHDLQRIEGLTGLRQTAKLRWKRPIVTARVECHQLPLATFTIVLQNTRESLAGTKQDETIRGSSRGRHLQISATPPQHILQPLSVLL